MLSTRLVVATGLTLLFAAPAALPAVTLPGPAPAAPRAALWGPPVICHPIAFEGGTSLPWGKDRFDRAAEVEPGTVVARTLELLEASHDPYLHMETLRRAVLYVMGGTKKDDPVKGGAEALVAGLEKRVETLGAALRAAEGEAAGEAAETARRDAAIACLDLGWTLEALHELSARPRSASAQEAAIEKALALVPDDPALLLGAAVVDFASGDQRRCWERLDAALARADDPKGLLARNADNTMGAMLGVRGRDLAKRVAEELDRA